MSALVWLLFATTVETEHYRVESEAAEAEAREIGRVLEAAWPLYEKFFKAKPRLKKGEKLAVKHFETREAWAAAIAADGATAPENAGGYYWPGTRTVFLYRQPTVYYSRVLLLHEAAHQFHFLARTKNKEPVSYWYTEGVAEHLSWHHWDGETLELAVVPNVSLKDYPALALQEMSAGGFDLEAAVKGEPQPSRAVAWALYRWTATQKQHVAFTRKMDAGNVPGALFRKMFGTPKAVAPKLRAWLETQQSPFGYVFNEWEGLGPGRMRGWADVISICHLRPEASFFEVTLEARRAAQGWRGGVVLHYEDPKNYSFAVLDWQGFVRIARMTDGSLKTLEQGHVPAVDQPADHTFQLFRRKEGVMMNIGTTGFGPWELPEGGFGLVVQRSDLRFSGIAWK